MSASGPPGSTYVTSLPPSGWPVVWSISVASVSARGDDRRRRRAVRRERRRHQRRRVDVVRDRRRNLVHRRGRAVARVRDARHAARRSQRTRTRCRTRHNRDRCRACCTCRCSRRRPSRRSRRRRRSCPDRHRSGCTGGRSSSGRSCTRLRCRSRARTFGSCRRGPSGNRCRACIRAGSSPARRPSRGPRRCRHRSRPEPFPEEQAATKRTGETTIARTRARGAKPWPPPSRQTVFGNRAITPRASRRLLEAAGSAGLCASR